PPVFLIHVFSHVVFITTYYNSMDGKMQCLYVSSFMEIFWTDFLEEGPDGVIAPLVETGGCG
ncbi:hypothetical protein, partial [Enterocloster bolteae]|uniref:hypothetical protein n=1 Tax=Enterocloster bolteae TaxID=208479 RepID=UPI002A83AF37